MRTPLIIAGPSAVGKTTVGYYLIDNVGGFELVRSLTTRQPRYDGHDDEYIFVSPEEFDEIYKNGGVLESTEYAGFKYGTPKSEIERISNEGKNPLLILDVEGVMSLTRHSDISPCAVYVYDTLECLEDRLYARFLGNGETEKGIKNYNSRKAQNITDYGRVNTFSEYFYSFVRNITLADTADQILLALDDFDAGKARDQEKISSALTEISACLK